MKKVSITTELKGCKVRINWAGENQIAYTVFNGNEEWAFLTTEKGSENFDILNSKISPVS